MLSQVRDFHGQLAEYYNKLSDEAAQQRVKMLLDYMSSHEKNLQKILAAYENISREVLDTWVDCRHCEEVLATCEQTPIAPETSVEGVTKVAMDVDRCLLRFYREVAENVEFETVRRVFTELVKMQEAELRKLAVNAQGAMDI
jgi:rubrerythrin